MTNVVGSGPPEAVHVVHPVPSYLSEYERIFQCPLRFEQPRNEIVFRRADLGLPVALADSVARNMFVAHAEKLLRHMDDERTMGEQVLAILMEKKPGGMPDIGETARRLHTTCSRREGEQGASPVSGPPSGVADAAHAIVLAGTYCNRTQRRKFARFVVDTGEHNFYAPGPHPHANRLSRLPDDDGKGMHYVRPRLGAGV